MFLFSCWTAKVSCRNSFQPSRDLPYHPFALFLLLASCNPHTPKCNSAPYHVAFTPYVQYGSSHCPIRYEEDIHQDFSLYWHTGGGKMNFSLVFKLLSHSVSHFVVCINLHKSQTEVCSVQFWLITALLYSVPNVLLRSPISGASIIALLYASCRNKCYIRGEKITTSPPVSISWVTARTGCAKNSRACIVAC